MAPVYTPMLLARTADSTDSVERRVGFAETAEDQVQSLEPHGHGRVDLPFILVGEDALFEGVFAAEVLVEVDFGGGNDGEVGADYDCW